MERKKKVYVNEDYCVGCGLCEVYCVVAHSKSGDVIKAFKEEKPRPLARIIFEESRPVTFGLQCRHCDDAPCVRACITGAMTKDEKTGVVTCDGDRCVGCWTCILVCPYGAVMREERESKYALKCDLCRGRKMPACVEHCPNGALVFK